MIPRRLSGGVFYAKGITVEDLIALAYDTHGNRIEGAPGWISSDLYSISAKADPALQHQLTAMRSDEAEQAQRQMLRSLLEDRFQLKATLKAKPGSIYELDVRKAGAKLSSPNVAADVAGRQSMFSVTVEGETLVFHQCSRHRLASLLSQLTQREIVDKTELVGQYDFRLTYKQEGPGMKAEVDTPELDDALVE